jgi:hypothetical protein
VRSGARGEGCERGEEISGASRRVLLEGRYEEWCEREGERKISARGDRRKGERRERGNKMNRRERREKKSTAAGRQFGG